MNALEDSDVLYNGKAKTRTWPKELEEKVIELRSKCDCIGDVVRTLHIPFDVASFIISEYNKTHDDQFFSAFTWSPEHTFSRESFYREQVLELRRKGLSYRTIEKITGLHRKSVGRILKKYNREHPHDQFYIPETKHLSRDESIKKQVKVLKESGYSPDKICSLLNISDSCLSKIEDNISDIGREYAELVVDWRNITIKERREIVHKAIKDRLNNMTVREVCRKYNMRFVSWLKYASEYNQNPKNKDKRVVVYDLPGWVDEYCCYLGDIKALLLEGKTGPEIASSIGISRAKVHFLISLLNKFSSKNKNSKKYATISSDDVVCLWNCGLSERRIAQLLKTTTRQVNLILADLEKAEESI